MRVNLTILHYTILHVQIHLHLSDALSKATYSAFRLYMFISMCVPWESNPQPFALLTQCSTTEPQEQK